MKVRLDTTSFTYESKARGSSMADSNGPMATFTDSVFGVIVPLYPNAYRTLPLFFVDVGLWVWWVCRGWGMARRSWLVQKW
jgi:hypothetical protein